MARDSSRREFSEELDWLPCANARRLSVEPWRSLQGRRVARKSACKSLGRKWKVMPHKITVLLADDHALVRRGFRRMLEDDAGISVVGEASDGEEAVRIATDLRPRVIVMDCAMPELSGIEATRKILKAYPEAGIL